MADFGQGPRSGARDNGLRCANYLVVGDLDPRVADSLLEALRDEGIAAYVTPTPSDRGGYLEMRVPSGLTDRLFADGDHIARAKAMLPAPEPTDHIDFDSAWTQVLQSLQTPTDESTASWPASENVSEPTMRQVPVTLPISTPEYDELGSDPALEDHFEPPPPPPLPRLRKPTIIGLLSIAFGVLILATNFDNGSLLWLAVVAIVSGVATLIWHMKDGPPIDSGWDDGAVV